MNRRYFLKNSALYLGALSLAGCNLGENRSLRKNTGNKQPNIVFILADDMGYGDIQAYNTDSKIPTPNLNRLVKQGVQFTDAHSGSAVCTPTRYGLMTGMYCWRTDLKSGVLFPPEDPPLIGQDRLTVAGMLKQQGYHTACIGKWHLGMEWGKDDNGDVDFNKSLEYGPTDVGFDEFFGIAGSLDMIPYVFYRNHKPTLPLTEIQPKISFPRFIREGPRGEGFDPGLVLDQLTDEAVDYINRRAAETNPFFLYFPMTAPHKPVWPTEAFQGKTDLGPYGDFIHQTDWSVGRVLEALEKNGINDNTLVIFSSDNGSYMFRRQQEELDHLDDPGIQGYRTSNHEANAMWRGTKADIWEAGHHIPFIARWPGQIKSGTHNEATICLTDLMSTCAEITGFSLPDNSGEDSFSLLPLMMGQDWTVQRAPVIHHSSQGMFSLREGKWKMVFGSGSGGRQKPVGKPFEEPYFLFDLENDPSETKNVIAQFPKMAEHLTEKLNALMNNGRSR